MDTEKAAHRQLKQHFELIAKNKGAKSED